MRAGLSLVTIACAAGLAAGANVRAQTPDAAEVARWTSALVVHYRMVGVYEGATTIAYREPGGTATVTDRVELELDWAPKSGTVIGEATIVNGASEVRELRNTHPSCPVPTPEGPYEHLTVTAVTGTPSALEIKGTRTFPQVLIVAGCMGVQEPKTVRAWRQDVIERLVVPSPVMLAAPANADPNVTVSADKRSFTIRNGPWTWTFTPTVVR